MNYIVKTFFAFLFVFLFSPLYASDNEIFSAKTPEGVDMSFCVISEAEKKCKVYGSPCIKSSTIGTITIPSSANGYTVTSIGLSAFYNCSDLTSITIPNSVTSIGNRAFEGCEGLNKVIIPNSVTSIGDRAYYKCSGLTDITFPNTITSIGSYAFYNCSSLTSITIPNSVTSIGSYAFQNCSSLTSISFPNSMTSIDDGTFYYCSGLTSVTVPNSITYIGSNAFAYCSSLTNITLSNSLTSIGYGVFSHCWRLTSITLPNSVTNIGSSAFSSCSSLTSITLPNSLTSIDSFTFAECSSLTSITIPNSVTSIGDRAFVSCSGLSSITISNSVASIGERAFEACNGLTNITLPNSLTNIGEYAFYGCSGLTSITLSNSLTNIGEYAFSNCSSLTSITIPNSVTSIGAWAFYNCYGLTSITLPNSLTSINAWVFSSCSSLTSITLPSSLTSIGSSAFSNCSSLTSITIPNSVTSIGAWAFNLCSRLSRIVSERKEPIEIREDVFSTYSNQTLYVPYGSSEKYKAIAGWNKISKIEESLMNNDMFTDFSKEGVEISFKVVNLIDRICQVGSDNSQSAIVGSDITIITIPEMAQDFKVTSIADAAFATCTSLECISVPASISTTGIQVFKNCENLLAIKWDAQAALDPSSVEGINNPNLLLYVKNKDYAPAGIQNVVVNGEAENIILKEAANGNNFCCPEEFMAKNIEFTHNYSMTSGYQTCQGWETIALPFDVTSIAHESYAEIVPITTWDDTSAKRPFWLYEQTAEGWKKATAIKANTPYVICMPNNLEHYDQIYCVTGNVTFKGTNVKVQASDNLNAMTYNGRTFVPNYRNQPANGSIYALNVNNEWDKYDDTNYLYGSTFIRNLRAVHPFECYMTTSDGSAREFIPIFEDNIPAGISDALRLMNNEEITNKNVYNLNGQQVQHPKKGVYIINGKKVVVK